MSEQKYYETLDDLSLYNWSKFIATKNNNWFLRKYKESSILIEDAYLDELAVRFQDEYFTLIDDDKFKDNLQKHLKLDNLKTRYFRICIILDRISLGFEDDAMDVRADYITILAKEGLIMPLLNSVEGDLEQVKSMFELCGQIRNQIAILEGELKVEDKQESSSLNRQLILVSKSLELGYMLNAKKISVAYWIELTKLIQEKNDHIVKE